jgi:WD40 repeat protein
MSFSPNGTIALLGLASGEICKLEVATTDIRCFQNGASRRVIDFAFNPKDSSQAISGSYCGGNPHGAFPDCKDTLILWDVNRGQRLHSFDGHTSTVTAVDFSPNGDSVVSGSSDLTIKLWDVQKGQERFTYRGHSMGVSDVAFSPNGEKILSGSADATLRLWDVKNPEQEPLLFIGHTTSVVAVAFGHDGRIALSGANDSLRLWDVQSGEELAKIPGGHSDTLLQAAFLQNDRTLLSLDRLPDNALRVWTLPPESLSEVVDWTVDNRYIRDFTCEERAKYQIEPLCSN